MVKLNRECIICGKKFYAKEWFIKHGWMKCCSNKCSAENKKTGKYISCETCSKIVYKPKSDIEKSKTGYHYCSRKCATINNNKIFKSSYGDPMSINNAKSYRRKATVIHGYKCANGNNCPLQTVLLPNYMLEVDHIDSNNKNNDISNLQVLCVWCHRRKTYNKEY